MDAALCESTHEALHTDWILDIDTTIKLLYGHQAGAEIGWSMAVAALAAYSRGLPLAGKMPAGFASLHGLRFKSQMNRVPSLIGRSAVFTPAPLLD